MKKVFFLSLMMITSCSFAQVMKFDSVSFVKPGVQEVILDASLTKDLEAFKDKNDAIIYIYRLSSMVGAAVKWQVQVDNEIAVKMGQKEYIAVHINTAEKVHTVTYPDMKYNYVNFKPNTYYMIMMKGFNLKTGYLDVKAINELRSCKRSNP